MLRPALSLLRRCPTSRVLRADDDTALHSKVFPGGHAKRTDTPGTAAGPNGPYNTHEERQRRGLGPSVANGAAGSRGCGAEGSLLQTCDLAEDRFRVPLTNCFTL